MTSNDRMRKMLHNIAGVLSNQEQVINPVGKRDKPTPTSPIVPPKQMPDSGFWQQYAGQFSGQEGIYSRYELYVGYWCEKDGWNVEYRGYTKHMHLQGIDLLCTKGNNVRVIKCNNWPENKQLSAAFIHQLTIVSLNYANENQNLEVKGMFVTSASISDEAKDFAKKFGVVCYEKVPFEPFPYVKCKVLSGGEKVYFTPLDGGYFDTVILPANGDMFCWNTGQAAEYSFKHIS